MEQTLKSRRQELGEKGLEVTQVRIGATALLSVLKQASSDRSRRGWGKLLGFFDLETKTLEVREAYGLMLPRSDEKMRKEDAFDEVLKKNANSFSAGFRQVGFFIFAEDDDVFTYSILNYLVNNDKFGPVKTFMHFSAAQARLGRNPVTFYEVSDQLNGLLTSKRVEADKYYYELPEEGLADFDLSDDSLFRSIPFEVVRGPVFEGFVRRHPEALEAAEEARERPELSDQVTSGLNEAIHRHAGHLQTFLSNKKSQRKAALVNLFGSHERLRATLAQKRELIAQIDRKMAQIENKIN